MGCKTSKDFTLEESCHEHPDQVHVLVVAINYDNTEEAGALTASTDAAHFIQLCSSVGIQDITVISDVGEGDEIFHLKQHHMLPTVEAISAAMEQIATHCKPDDTFIFYYAGHGTGVPDENGDEEDGQDEAFCTLGDDYEMDADTIWVDDEFTQFLIATIPAHTKVICFTDCCHSGSILDLDHYVDVEHVKNRAICAISGAKDEQTAKEVDEGGGVATTVMLKAIKNLDSSQDGPYSVAGVFYEMRRIMTSEGYNSSDRDQNLVLSHTEGHPAEQFPWPLSKLAVS
jgi:hypothetical protein